MTCIAGLVDGGDVWIGGDSAGVGGNYALFVRADEKVFRNGDFLFGFTSSFRMGQLLRYALAPPDHDPRVATDKYLCTTFMNAVRQCLKDGGYAEKRNDSETGGTFLIGYKGGLYTVEDDYQVAKVSDGFTSVGCGFQLAIGSLHSTKQQAASARVQTALEAAERFCAGVRGPFKIECLRGEVKT